jgi:iron complex outermembrane receptor protein
MNGRGVAARAASFIYLAGSIGAMLAPGGAMAQTTTTTTLDPIRIEGERRRGGNEQRQQPTEQQTPPPPPESAWGPVQGYAATRSATASKTDTPIQEIPQSISVIGSEQIRDQSAQTVQEALRYTPGVYADAYGPDTRGDGERIRGTDPVIYLDGMRLLNGGYWNQNRPDPYTLSRIEVLRGPASVLYGDAPTGGIINLVSKRPQEKEHREIGFLYGSYDYKQVQTDMTGKLTADGQWLYRIVGIYRDAEYQTDFVDNDRALIMPAITWRPTQNTNWTVIGLYQKDKTGSSTAFLPLNGTLFPNPNGQIPINRFTSEPGFDLYKTTTQSITSLFDHTFSSNFKVRSNMRYAHIDGVYRTMYPNNYTNYFGPFMPFFPYTDATQQSVHRIVYSNSSSRDAITSDTNGELNFGTGPVTHKVLFGLDARSVSETSSTFYDLDLNPFNLYNPIYGKKPIFATYPSLTEFPDPGIRQQQYGLYIQDQMRFGPWLVTAGIRNDRVIAETENAPKQFDEAVSRRLGLMYETPFGLNPYVSYSESFTPIFGSNICATLCKPVEGKQYEAGFKYRVSNSAFFNGAVFEMTEKNRLAAGPNPTFSVQTGEVKTRGLELEYVGSVTPDLDIIASYSYIDARIEQGDFAGARPDTVPLHYASVWAKQKLTLFGIPGFSVGGGVRYIGESWSTGISPVTGLVQTIETPGNTLYDAMVAWENDHWRFQVNGTNLADKIYFSSCLARGDCFYGTRRTIMSALTYKF